MKTKIFILAAFLTLCLSTGFSQINTIDNPEEYSDSDPLTAMNSAIEPFNTADSGTNATVAKITAFPEFSPNGEYADVNSYIYSNLEFPEEARVTGRSGLVKVQFDIYTNGSIGNINFVESPDSAFNEEVLRLLNKMPDWKPAFSGHNPVKSRYQLNINFSLR